MSNDRQTSAWHRVQKDITELVFFKKQVTAIVRKFEKGEVNAERGMEAIVKLLGVTDEEA